MFLIKVVKDNFCTKNLSNTFKIRSRLAEFFKHVHPDQMNQAPVILIFYRRQKLNNKILDR
jgi:hypothetical protein